VSPGVAHTVLAYRSNIYANTKRIADDCRWASDGFGI